MMATTGVSLYWKGTNAFLSATNAQLTFEDGTVYSFMDDQNRPQVINSGGEGEEISREDSWQEGGIERRLKFYFSYPPGADSTSTLYESRAYDQSAQWVYANLLPDSQITLPANGLFHCDTVEFHYLTECSPGIDACSPATFVADDFYVGAYLDSSSYDECTLDVSNPCANNPDGAATKCQAVDGVVTCVVVEDAVSPRQAEMEDSRLCSSSVGPSSNSTATSSPSNETSRTENPTATPSVVSSSTGDPSSVDTTIPTGFPPPASVPPSVSTTNRPSSASPATTTTSSPSLETTPPQCPAVTEPCMNEENFAQCTTLIENGCTQLLIIMESCPLQFGCDDTQCPDVDTSACVNEENRAACLELERNGCPNIAVLESCPVQFACADDDSSMSSSPPVDTNNSTTVSSNSTTSSAPTVQPVSDNTPAPTKSNSDEPKSLRLSCALLVSVALLLASL